MYQNRTDYELVQEFLKGDHSSLEALINRHRRKVFSYILFNIKDSHLAEDIFQDTFIKVIRSLKQGRYNDNGKFLSWVLRISHNLIIDHFRKEKQLQTISNDNCGKDMFNSQKFSDKTIEDHMVNSQISREIRQLVQELPQDQKEVVILRHYCDMSFKEIADHTNVSINTALGRMRYALINLRKLVEEKNLSLSMA
ncbi:MAG: sigma-70 family RNA polymerase sigma factor [Bacteroidales bacterium]|nr:sigma-70 family RNA polymerase sigma factor [Bacteroidales bacterium]